MKPENNKGDNGEKEYPANYRATYVALACLLYQTFRSGALRFHPSGALVLVGEGNASRRNPFALSFDNLLKGVATKGNVGAYSLAELLSDIFYKRREGDFIFRVVGNDKNLTPVKAWFRLFRESNECCLLYTSDAADEL